MKDWLKVGVGVLFVGGVTYFMQEREFNTIHAQCRAQYTEAQCNCLVSTWKNVTPFLSHMPLMGGPLFGLSEEQNEGVRETVGKVCFGLPS